MVKKEDLFDWFKNLQPHKRLDYMCTLLHMCLPLELRFIGSVLEDLARKDFHHLRDAEIKANQRNDLSNNPTNNIDDAHLRNKVSIALALMNSTNSSCADIIFTILESQVDGLLQLSRNKDIADQISLILTMSVYHPAFKFYQRNRLGEILQLVLDRIKDHFGAEDDTPFHIKQPRHPETYAAHSSLAPYSSHSSVPEIPEKVIVKTIEVVDSREDQSSKKGGVKHREESGGWRGGPEYEIHTTWSNGEVTQIFFKYKQLQELHYKVLKKFPEEKEKKQRTIPVFPGNHSHRLEPLKAQIESLNTYLSQLTKAPSHVLESDILHTALRNGPVIRRLPSPQAPPQPAIKASSPVSPQSGPQTVFSQPSPLHEDDYQYAISSYRGSMCDNPAILTNSLCSSDPSHLSSSTNSPANSRTSSPAPLASGKTGLASPAARKAGGGLGVPVTHQHHQSSNIELSLNQLLCLLNLENYSDNLKEFSFKQILSMSIEDYSKAGLSVEAQLKLRTKLDQLKLTAPQGRNGIISNPPGMPPLPHQQQQQLHPTAPVAEVAQPLQYSCVHLTPSQLAYMCQPVNPFSHLHSHHILPYHQLTAASLISSASATNNLSQPPQPMASSLTSSQIQQDLLTSPDFPNSEASTPPTSPHLGQESLQQHQQRSGNTSGGSSSSSCDGIASGHPAPVLVPTPLPMMSPPAAVAADTLALSEVKQLKGKQPGQMHGLEESGLEEEDMRAGFQEANNLGKAKVMSQPSGHVTGGSLPLLTNASPVVGSADESVMIVSGGPNPLLHPEILLRTDGTPPPPLPSTALAITSQSSAMLPNGYMVDSPLHVQPPAMIGRGVHTLPRGIGSLGGYKLTAQPTHTTPGKHNVVKMPVPDHPTLAAGGAKNSNGNNGNSCANSSNQGLMAHPAPAIPPHHHSYMPPPMAGPPHQSNNNGNNNIITSSSGASNGSIQLISQPPPLLPPAEGSYQPATYSVVFGASQQHQQQRGILTSMAGLPNVINTTQSHQSGHPPSPGCSDVGIASGMYQVNPGEALPAETSGDNRGTPPNHVPSHQVNSVKAQSHPSGQHSSTPSPPLVSSSGNGKTAVIPLIVSSSMLPSGNEPLSVPIRGGTGGAQPIVPYYFMMPTQNGIVQQQFYAHPHHPPQQPGGHHPQPPPPPPPTFPNGMGPGGPGPAHDHFLRPLHAAPQFTTGGQVPPSFYGNSVYPPRHHHHLQQQQHHHPNSNSSSISNNHHGRSTGSPAGGASSQAQTMSVCYNCGQPGHRAAECKESTMENMSNSYRLSFEPKADPQ